MTGKYANRKAFVTGSASGIGKRLVQHLTEHGAIVICVDKNESLGQEAVDALNSGRTTAVAFFVKADVTSWKEVVTSFQTAETILRSGLDFVFANAGSAAIGFPNCPDEPNLSPIHVNLAGVVFTIQAAINHFRKHGSGGRIVVTASQASLHPFPGEPLYTASKAGVMGLVRATGPVVKREGIYVNAIAPGSTDSALMPKEIEEGMNSFGWAVSKETIMRAFDTFLAPDCRLAGQVAEAVGDYVGLYEFSLPTKNRLRGRL
ncbi:hypothetical protein CERSUDRAFT_115709 [Gelatoporia subvermispora B]|uniref:Uncharacterized protein n=1 Tax=Ceriporiopsis subvermispora (strain B) TaxID=914234 RepID=M2PI25_CERS8|nr:hypothetical protein CERSUDRAFT_115709 [Gelatoporia subvermispora B]